MVKIKCFHLLISKMISLTSSFLVLLYLTKSTSEPSENLTLLMQSRSGYLEKYVTYVNTVMMHFRIPEDTLFAAFKFRGIEKLSRCNPKDVQLYLKQGSPPVLNPEGSAFSDKFFWEGRPKAYKLSFLSNRVYEWANLSYPLPGSYYAAMFFPYTDPKDDAITQDGLFMNCQTYVDVDIFISTTPVKTIFPISENKFTIFNNETKAFKFYIPENKGLTILSFDVKCDKCIKFKIMSIPKNMTKVFSVETKIEINLQNENEYLLIFNEISDLTEPLNISFTIDYQDLIIGNYTFKNGTYLNAIKKYSYVNNELKVSKQYDLHKIKTYETFSFSFEMQPINNSIPLAINVTSFDYSVLKFSVDDIIDVGGSLEVSLAYKPRYSRQGRLVHKDKEPERNIIVVCIGRNNNLIPTWGKKCQNETDLIDAGFVLNKTSDNESLHIPFPESGDWFVSFKLFCDECQPCDCPKVCELVLEECLNDCNHCDGNYESYICKKCEDCRKSVYKKDGCKDCDCVDGCKRVEKICNTTVLFDVSSQPCISYGCGTNGKCVYLVSEAFVYSSCSCSNNYKGWDCSDGSDAHSMGYLLGELLLLVLSNLLFLPAVYIAYIRKYYVEMVLYFFIWFFSSFYHSCDAGENIISFCIARLSVLQFCDFYCALLAIWVTLIAMAHLSQTLTQVLYIIGAVFISAGTAWDKTSIWAFLLPVSAGAGIVIVSWGLKYWKTKVVFPSVRYLKRNLPSGLIVVTIGLLMYSLLQTQSNYKYLHSIWHMLMAAAVIILLPDLKTFLPNIVPL